MLLKALKVTLIMLECSYKSSSKPKVGSYYWLKDTNLPVKNNTQEFLGRVTVTLDEGFLEGRADVVIQDLRLNDSGIYRFMVNIPGLPEASGKGIELQVLKKGNQIPEFSWKELFCHGGIETKDMNLWGEEWDMIDAMYQDIWIFCMDSKMNNGEF